MGSLFVRSLVITGVFLFPVWIFLYDEAKYEDFQAKWVPGRGVGLLVPAMITLCADTSGVGPLAGSQATFWSCSKCRRTTSSLCRRVAAAKAAKQA